MERKMAMKETPAKMKAPAPVETKLYNLPVISEINDQDDMDRAVVLLVEGRRISEEVRTGEKALKEIKDQLQQIGIDHDLNTGMRHGNLAVTFVDKSRESLDVTLLIENGVKPEVIANSKKTSTYKEVRFWEVAR